jgi:CheY-like chemotaxis protein
MTHSFGVPTILVAQDDIAICGALIRDLQRDGYFVLVAHDGPEATEIVRVHSRRIQLMLTSDSADGRTLAATLKPYRPDMQVLFITGHAKESAPDLTSSDAAVGRVREFLKPPESPGAEPKERPRAMGAH